MTDSSLSGGEITLSEFLDEKERVWLDRLEDTILAEPPGKQVVVDPADWPLFQKLPKSKFETCVDPERLATGFIGTLRLKGGGKTQEIHCKPGVGQGWMHFEVPGVAGRKMVHISTVVMRGASSGRRPG